MTRSRYSNKLLAPLNIRGNSPHTRLRPYEYTGAEVTLIEEIDGALLNSYAFAIAHIRTRSFSRNNLQVPPTVIIEWLSTFSIPPVMLLPPPDNPNTTVISHYPQLNTRLSLENNEQTLPQTPQVTPHPTSTTTPHSIFPPHLSPPPTRTPPTISPSPRQPCHFAHPRQPARSSLPAQSDISQPSTSYCLPPTNHPVPLPRAWLPQSARGTHQKGTTTNIKCY
ncbi:uncharacterized protein LOC129005616 [Macrosteles quadrilineatus]|uniref:uncharacterized protein LOC129005616 n=1 Tax=Macrosteles quadrilineatus TaxID=74068 RepID=UPI0023E30B00|nr:uncharacterized protein LOC129005616 [Macrosteles quadrilineatus]